MKFCNLVAIVAATQATELTEVVLLGKDENTLGDGPIPEPVVEGFGIAYGILMGAVKAEGLDNMQKCFSGPIPIVEDITEMVIDFKKGSIDDVIHGL